MRPRDVVVEILVGSGVVLPVVALLIAIGALAASAAQREWGSFCVALLAAIVWSSILARPGRARNQEED